MLEDLIQQYTESKYTIEKHIEDLDKLFKEGKICACDYNRRKGVLTQSVDYLIYSIADMQKLNIRKDMEYHFKSRKK